MKAMKDKFTLTPMLFLISISFITLILLPKSLPLLKLGGFEFGWGIGDVLLIFVFFLSIGRIFLTGKIKFLHGVNHLDKAFLLYFISLLCPVVIAGVRYPEKIIFVIAGYIKYLEAFMIYYLIRKTLNKTREANYLLKNFVIVLIGVLAISLVQKMFPNLYLIFWKNIGSQSRAFSETFIKSIGWRLSGPFFNPNTLAQFLLLAIPVSLINYSFNRKVITRLFYLCVIIISIIIFILTQSRSAYLGFLFSLLVIMYYTGFRFVKFKAMQILIVIVLMAVCLFYKSFLYHRIVEYTLYIGTSIAERFMVWKVGIHAINRYWLVGIGTGGSGTALQQFNISAAGTHNTFFRSWIEGGIIVFGIFLFLLLEIWLWRKAKLIEPWNYYKYAFIASFVGLIVTGFSGDTFQNSEIMISFMFILGILNSIYQIERGEELFWKTHLKK